MGGVACHFSPRSSSETITGMWPSHRALKKMGFTFKALMLPLKTSPHFNKGYNFSRETDLNKFHAVCLWRKNQDSYSFQSWKRCCYYHYFIFFWFVNFILLLEYLWLSKAFIFYPLFTDMNICDWLYKPTQIFSGGDSIVEIVSEAF